MVRFIHLSIFGFKVLRVYGFMGENNLSFFKILVAIPVSFYNSKRLYVKTRLLVNL